MGCQMLGLAPAEIHHLLPEITAFAELADYMEQPLRSYSTGMQMRLAFAVATAVRPEVLIVDEALSVGDAYFQHKSFKRIRSFREAGTTLLFVSHDPAAVKSLCDRALLIDHGRLIRSGTRTPCSTGTTPGRRARGHRRHRPAGRRRLIETRSGNGLARFAAVELLDDGGQRRQVFQVETAPHLPPELAAAPTTRPSACSSATASATTSSAPIPSTSASTPAPVPPATASQ
jgi:lipopolysaccharide transport system ATP-binding protein